MNTDLDRLIHLQQLETQADEARRRIAEYPELTSTLESRLQSARDAVLGVKARIAVSQESRRAQEKEVAGVQARLAKYKDQLLEVKTNREYQAMLHEIETAQNDIRVREDGILEIMLGADELAAELKTRESELKAAEKAVAAERQTLDSEIVRLQSELEQAGSARQKLAAEINRSVLATFETVSKGRKGVGVAEARDGHCTICHVRLRPQVFNLIRRNDSIIQCDSCQRILYFAGEQQTPAAPPQ
jgi:predicted  nucleic acid-binding Zn-ribbon protein